MVRKTDNPEFDKFWRAYPRRSGDEGKTPAKLLFEKLVKSGRDPQELISSAERFALLEKKSAGTQYMMQAQKWLRNSRWKDFPAPLPLLEAVSTVFVPEGTPQWKAWQDYLHRTKNKGSPCVNFGWRFPSEWPPGIINPDASVAEIDRSRNSDLDDLFKPVE